MAKTDFHVKHSTRRPAEDREKIPRAMMRAIFGLLVVIVALVAWARITERPLVGVAPISPVLDTREITLESDTSGSALVRDINGDVLVDLGPNKGGFLSTMWRVVKRERTRHRVDLGGPVTVRAHENGRISLYDPSTDKTIELTGFGSDNVRAFRELLEK